MTVIPLYHVDAFASKLFTGNPAAVCPLDEWLPDQTMQAIATENNLSETAFFIRQDGGYHLRWMTPRVEVDLCGHATLASAFVILNLLEPGKQEVRFHTRSGELVVTKSGELLAMDFPARPPLPVEPAADLLAGLKIAPQEVLAARDYFVVYSTADQVRSLDPDMALLEQAGHFGVIVTAPGQDCDFVSRYFGPAIGIPEDPVTGSAHSTLIPYWSGRLNKPKLYARQISRRGGELHCQDRAGRVLIAGAATLYLKGEICL